MAPYTTYAELLTDGSELWEATALSPDGRYIVGWGYNATSGFDEAFLLDTHLTGDVDGDGCIDDADLLAVLFAFGQSGSELPEDVKGDGVVDDADLLEVLFRFGRGCFRCTDIENTSITENLPLSRTGRRVSSAK